MIVIVIFSGALASLPTPPPPPPSPPSASRSYIMASPIQNPRTSEFPDPFYPDHWGPFFIHDIFPIDQNLCALDVEYYQICTVFPESPIPIYLGFDDFAPVWPIDPEMSEHAIRRRDRIRATATFRALVRVKSIEHLVPEGIEKLRNVGADVSETICREGELVVAVMGAYSTHPLYYRESRFPENM